MKHKANKKIAILALFLSVAITSYADDEPKIDPITRNNGAHIDLAASASVFALNGKNDDYLGYLISPQLRARYGFWNSHSVFAAFGYGQISQFTDNKEDQKVVEKKEEVEYTTSIGWAIALKSTTEQVQFGFDHFVIGIGSGNFQTNPKTNTYENGMFLYAGFTINAIDIWISKP